MKLAFIATRGKEKIEVILDENIIFHRKEKSYPSSIQARTEYERLKRLYKGRKYKIRTVFSTPEQEKLLKKQKERVKSKQTTLTRKTIMGIKVRLAENENNKGR